MPLRTRSSAFLDALPTLRRRLRQREATTAVAESFPASDPPAHVEPGHEEPARRADRGRGRRAASRACARGDGRREFELDHGSVVIAAITSCTNTSNPQVMVAAGLLAKKAVERGLDRKPWVKSSLAPGSTRRHRLLREGRARRPTSSSSASTPSATAARPASATPARCRAEISDGDRRRTTSSSCAVLSGNRNFEARIHPEVKANYLASPPLVVAYALAGRMDIDLTTEPIGQDRDGQRRLPARHLADARRRSQDAIAGLGLGRDVPQHATPTSSPATTPGARLDTPDGRPLRLGPGLDLRAPAAVLRRHGARAGAGRATSTARAASSCSATRSRPTTSRPPARSSPTARPGSTCVEHGVERRDFNSLRLAPRQPRGDGARHVRQRPPAQPARPRQRGRRGRCTSRPARR